MNKKLIMFDFDGVLIDTLLACYSINTKVNDSLSIEEYKSFFEGNINHSFRWDGTPRSKHPDFFTEYNEGTRELKIPLVLKKVILELSKKYRLTIVSSTITKSIEDILRREDLNDCFEDILGNDIHASKVIKITSLLEKYHQKPEESLFITDTLGDIREADTCKVCSIAITWGFHERATLEKGNPAVIIDDPAMLIPSIETMLQ